jgi:hypothetical protein
MPLEAAVKLEVGNDAETNAQPPHLDACAYIETHAGLPLRVVLQGSEY